MSIEDLVQSAFEKDYNKANQTFGDIMTAKLNDVLDQEKIKVAGQMFNGDEPDEEQLDLPLEDEDENIESEDPIPAEEEAEENTEEDEISS